MKKLKVLVACEFSGRVRNAFLKLGHDAISCDLLPTDSPGPHYQGDVFDIINDGFDLMIAHPPCTFLTCAAEWAYKDIQTKKIKPGTLIGQERRLARIDAAKFFMDLFNADIEHICIENPVGVMSSIFRPADQTIQPYEYGEDASKRTCLWLKNLPLLNPTKYIEPRIVCCGETILSGDKYSCSNCNGNSKVKYCWSNQTNTGQNKLAPSKDRWKLRSTTYQGIADAFAMQFGGQV